MFRRFFMSLFSHKPSRVALIDNSIGKSPDKRENERSARGLLRRRTVVMVTLSVVLVHTLAALALGKLSMPAPPLEVSAPSVPAVEIELITLPKPAQSDPSPRISHQSAARLKVNNKSKTPLTSHQVITDNKNTNGSPERHSQPLRGKPTSSATSALPSASATAASQPQSKPQSQPESSSMSSATVLTTQAALPSTQANEIQTKTSVTQTPSHDSRAEDKDKDSNSAAKSTLPAAPPNSSSRPNTSQQSADAAPQALDNPINNGQAIKNRPVGSGDTKAAQMTSPQAANAPVVLDGKEARWDRKPSLSFLQSADNLGDAAKIQFRIKMSVDEKGRLSNVIVVSGPTDIKLRNRVIRAVRGARLKPFERDGRAVAGVVTVSLTVKE